MVRQIGRILTALVILMIMTGTAGSIPAAGPTAGPTLYDQVPLPAGISQIGQLKTNGEIAQLLPGTGWKEVKVFTGGQQVMFEVPPVFEAGRLLVPYQAIAGILGATAGWDETARTVEVAGQGRTVVFIVDRKNALVNGQEVNLEVPARIIDNEIFVPLRFLSERLGNMVAWEAGTRSVQIKRLTSISGIVRDDAGPVADAVVRVQTTPIHVVTDADGRFVFNDLDSSSGAALTAFVPGYYIAGPVLGRPGDNEILFVLERHPAEDNPDYQWLSAFSTAGHEFNCQNCHSDPEDPNSLLPFEEWQQDAHGNSATNRRFLSMYNGTDLTGQNRSPDTRYAFNRDYGKFPLRPDFTQPYYGTGFKLDFPGSQGNCAACHLPAAAANAPYDTNPNHITGVGLEGVACDLCHKTWDVKLDPATGLPYPNMPGILSIEFRRPQEGEQLFIGPFDDVPGLDTFSPLQQQSELCAPCHTGQFWGVEVYNSFGEWLTSPYADPETGQTCQDCHMPRRGTTHFTHPDKDGLQRDPQLIASHLMPGAADTDLLQDTAKLEIEAQRQGDRILVKVEVTNSNGGHHIPTDHPARNILLVVSATDAWGRELEYLGDQLIPDWGGAGSEQNDYAGRPGKGYAKILEELWTEISPTAAYWQPTTLLEDTRIPAMATDTTYYEFRIPPQGGPVAIESKLIYRRAFKSLAEQKAWDVPDVLMEIVHYQVP